MEKSFTLTIKGKTLKDIDDIKQRISVYLNSLTSDCILLDTNSCNKCLSPFDRDSLEVGRCNICQAHIIR
ncbi:MAG: hypothetical protein WC942_04045 [Clostridia bacterium]|jgi:hypothetical protein